LDPSESAASIEEAAVRRRRFGWPDTLISRSIRGNFQPEGPLRFMAASALL